MDELQATLPPDLGAVANEWPAEYHDEIARRVDSIRAGRAHLLSADEFWSRLKNRP
ncbi:MAG: hypothetical protein M3Y59_01330 [Myxococcota bacterium]|nr:hypothetical protein [Myxococcota bacterium]